MPRELVVESACDKPPDDRPRRLLLTKPKFADAALDALCGQSAMDAFDDVGAFAQRPHGGLGVLRQVPLRWTERLGETSALELLHARDDGRPYVSLGYTISSRPQVDDSIMLRGLASERLVEPSPDVGIVGVPVVHPNPIELRAEIALGLRHQIPGELLKIGELLGILRRDDKAEMMPVPFAAIGERAVVGIVVLGAEHPAGGALLRYAFPAQVEQVILSGARCCL